MAWWEILIEFQH